MKTIAALTLLFIGSGSAFGVIPSSSKSMRTKLTNLHAQSNGSQLAQAAAVMALGWTVATAEASFAVDIQSALKPPNFERQDAKLAIEKPANVAVPTDYQNRKIFDPEESVVKATGGTASKVVTPEEASADFKSIANGLENAASKLESAVKSE